MCMYIYMFLLVRKLFHVQWHVYIRVWYSASPAHCRCRIYHIVHVWKRLWAVRLQWHTGAMNALRRCQTPTCTENVVPTAVKSQELGGCNFHELCVCDGVLWKVLCSKHIHSTWATLALHPRCIYCSPLYSCTVRYTNLLLQHSQTCPEPGPHSIPILPTVLYLMHTPKCATRTAWQLVGITLISVGMYQ